MASCEMPGEYLIPMGNQLYECFQNDVTIVHRSLDSSCNSNVSSCIETLNLEKWEYPVRFNTSCIRGSEFV